MLNQEDIEKVKNEVSEFFKRMTFEVEASFPPQTEDTVFVSLRAQEPQILIGEGGQTLNEIQHLLRAILRKKITERFFLDLDISDYKKKKNHYLKEMARSAADEVALTRIEKTLVPMSAYERRIIHAELANRSDVITESTGLEPERKIVVKPSPGSMLY